MTEKQSCEMPESNPLEIEIKEILENSKTIAVVGLSDNPERDSYRGCQIPERPWIHDHPGKSRQDRNPR